MEYLWDSRKGTLGKFAGGNILQGVKLWLYSDGSG